MIQGPIGVEASHGPPVARLEAVSPEAFLRQPRWRHLSEQNSASARRARAIQTSPQLAQNFIGVTPPGPLCT